VPRRHGDLSAWRALETEMNDNAPTTTPANAVALCRRKLIDSNPIDYYSAVFAPADRRAAAFALYAFWQEVRETVDECSEVDVALRKLAWWHDEVQAMYAGQPRHPVSIALVPALTEHKLSQTTFLDLVRTVVHHAHTPRYATFSQWHEYAIGSRGRLVQLVAALLGAETAAVAELGAFQELAMAIRDVGADVRRGRLNLAEEDLARFGVQPEDIDTGRENESLRRLMAAMTDRAITGMAQACRSWTPTESARLLPLRIGAHITRALLAEISADGYRTLSRRVELTPLRQLWIAWRTSRQKTNLL
jgi:15-cis-phytoene synthase